MLFILIPVAGVATAANARPTAKPQQKAVVCPVTGERIAPNMVSRMAHVKYRWKTYYFCCPGCQPVFVKAPEKYLKLRAASQRGRVRPA